MKKTILIVLSLGIFVVSCMNPHGVVISDSSKVLAKLTIAPPTFARTLQTKDLWLTETSVQIELEMPTMNGLMKRLTSTTTATTDTVVNGMHISATIKEGESIKQYMSGNWMMMAADSLEHHMAASLTNASSSTDSVGPLPILYSTVTLIIKSGSLTVDSALLIPVHGASGPMYAANVAMPLDMATYSFEVHATAPQTSWRDMANQNRLLTPMHGSFSAVVHSAPTAEELLGSSLVADSVMMALSISQPQTLWLWDSLSHMPVQTAPLATATLFASVKLTDLKSRSNGEIIGYSMVRCQLMNENHTDSTMTQELNPVHGGSGFYYGANMLAPAMSHSDGH